MQSHLRSIPLLHEAMLFDCKKYILALHCVVLAMCESSNLEEEARDSTYEKANGTLKFRH